MSCNIVCNYVEFKYNINVIYLMSIACQSYTWWSFEFDLVCGTHTSNIPQMLEALCVECYLLCCLPYMFVKIISTSNHKRWKMTQRAVLYIHIQFFCVSFVLLADVVGKIMMTIICFFIVFVLICINILYASYRLNLYLLLRILTTCNNNCLQLNIFEDHVGWIDV